MEPDQLDPEQFLAELRELQKKLPSFDDGAPPPSRLDAELILGEIASIRRRIPFLADVEPRPPEDARFRSLDGMPIETEEDFEWAAVIDAMESLHEDLTASIERKQEILLEMMLDLYYAAEEASRDPENAHLIEQVEYLRAMYERDYGRPIPPKGK